MGNLALRLRMNVKSMACTNNGQRLVDLEVDLATREVLRMMGGAHRRPIESDVLSLVSRLMSEAAPCVQARGVYLIRDVEGMTDRELKLRGCPPFFGPIAKFLRPAQRVAVYVVTIGDAIERRASQWASEGHTVESYTLHAIGSAAAAAAVDALVEHLWTHEAGPGEGVTLPFSPGYCGIPLEQQQTLFSIIDSAAIGVTLLPSMLMVPLKSVSGLAGIGNAKEIEIHGVPCEYCDLERCSMRRED